MRLSCASLTATADLLHERLRYSSLCGTPVGCGIHLPVTVFHIAYYNSYVDFVRVERVNHKRIILNRLQDISGTHSSESHLDGALQRPAAQM